MESPLFFVLGATDPEMQAIERLLQSSGTPYAYAMACGSRVHPGNAYRADALSSPIPEGALVVQVDCGGSAIPEDAIVCDHHFPGDPGYGQPAENFLRASSIGQVLLTLAKSDKLKTDWHEEDHISEKAEIDQLWYGKWCITWPDRDSPVSYGSTSGSVFQIPEEILFVAAADHCLAAAYHGACPGVDPEALMRWRAESRAAFQGRPVADVLADIEAAKMELLKAPEEYFGANPDCPQCGGTGHHENYNGDYSASGQASDDIECACTLEYTVADIGDRHIPELPEAACRSNIAYICETTTPDGRRKKMLGAASPKLIKRWMDTCALVDVYGDPARGFAGGYLEEQTHD